jgi:hypothetical protein
MPFHVELSSSVHRARNFNLEHRELMETVVEPWLEGRPISLGEREWEPLSSSLKILEGPRLEPSDLSFGQGWANAERASNNVTQRELEQAPAPRSPDAFVIETELPEATVATMLAGQEAKATEWPEARERIDSRDPQIAAVILVVKRSGPEAPQS